MKVTKEPQIKTLEVLLIHILQSSSKSDRAHTAFKKMLEHFIDEDFLYTTFHQKIITLIYKDNFYKTHYAFALPQKLHIDNKTLLEHRKNYMLLFAKYYLKLTHNSKNIFLALQAALEKEKAFLAVTAKNKRRN